MVTDVPRIIELVISSGRRVAVKTMRAGSDDFAHDEKGLRSNSAVDLPERSGTVFSSNGTSSAR